MAKSVKEYHVKPCDVSVIRPFIEKWHYSKSINGVRSSYCFAMWEGDESHSRVLVGAMLYGMPGMANAWKPYGEKESDVLELRRLCCIDVTPQNAESYFIGKTLKWLKNNTLVKNIVSYSDMNHGHEGTIYKASNFRHDGITSPGRVIIRLSDGKQYHDKTIRTMYNGKLKPFAQKIKEQLENGEAEYRNTVGKNIFVYELKRKKHHNVIPVSPNVESLSFEEWFN